MKESIIESWIIFFSCKRGSIVRHNMARQRFFLWFLILFFGGLMQVSGQSQLYIPINNPSLEGIPSSSRTPLGWFHCGSSNESPPDTQPSFFGEQIAAYNGYTYVGMVARESGSRESIGQQLEFPLESGHCYELKVHIARSDDYESRSRDNPEVKSFTTPLRLALYGSQTYCDGQQLLATSPLIISTEWEPYSFHFFCEKAMNGLLFQVEYSKDSVGYYNGNILLDHISPLLEIDCETNVPLINLDRFESSVIIEDWPYFLNKNGGNDLEINEPFVGEDGAFRCENKTVYELLRALEKKPLKRLVILINSKLGIQKKFRLRTEILNQFYHHPQVIVTTKKRGLRSMKWLYSDEKMRLGLK